MTNIPKNAIDQIINIESEIHYGEVPPPDHLPFIAINRDSPIILSAPHGAITFRNDKNEIWHEEDEYTAAIALFLSEYCNTSIIASVWRTEDSDPNFYGESRSPYKRRLREMIIDSNIQWLIDLHGAATNSKFLSEDQIIDLGNGKTQNYLPDQTYKELKKILNNQFGVAATERKNKQGFPASEKNTIAGFCKQILEINAVQIEMKPSVRVVRRKVDASMYNKPIAEGGGPYSAPANNVMGMMQVLVDFIEYLKEHSQ